MTMVAVGRYMYGHLEAGTEQDVRIDEDALAKFDFDHSPRRKLLVLFSRSKVSQDPWCRCEAPEDRETC